MTDAIADRVRKVLHEVLGVPSSALASDARLDEIAPIDSLSLAELAGALDEEFAIEVAGDRLSSGLSVPKIVALVRAALERVRADAPVSRS